MASSETSAEAKPRKTYEAGCHCGYIKFSVTLSPPLPQKKPLNCDCSACRRFGYLLVCMLSAGGRDPESTAAQRTSQADHVFADPPREDVKWHGDSWGGLSKYQFNTKQKDHLFCGKCGASLGIDFRDFHAPDEYPVGVSVRIASLPSLPVLTPPHLLVPEFCSPDSFRVKKSV